MTTYWAITMKRPKNILIVMVSTGYYIFYVLCFEYSFYDNIKFASHYEYYLYIGYAL